MDNDIELHRVPSPAVSTLTTKYSQNGHDQGMVDTARLVPDLEAQEQTSPLFTKQGKHKRFPGPRQRLEKLDLLLKSQVPAGNRSHDFIRDWLHFKETPGGGALFNALCEYKTSHPPVYQSLEYVLPKTLTQQFNSSEESPSSTFEECLQILLQWLQLEYCDSFQLCLLSADTKDSQKAFSFLRKAKASVERLPRMYSSPQHSISCILKAFWPLPAAVEETLLARSPPEELCRGPKLPSIGHSSKVLDVYRNCQPFSVSWHARAPKFEGDLDVYVWQPYVRPPIPEFAQIFLGDGADTRRRRALILFRSSRSLAAYSDLYSLTRSAFLTNSAITQWTAIAEVILSIIVVFKQLTAEIFEFLHGSQGLFAQTSTMVFEGRKRPSGSKVQYLLHLEDCRVQTAQGLERQKLLLRDLEGSLSDSGHISSAGRAELALLGLVGEIALDVDYLVEETRTAKAAIEELRKMIIEQISLTQVRRSAVLGFLAALFLPLAYVSGLFGMNISGSSLGFASTNLTKLYNDTTLDFTRLTINQTDDLISAFGSANSYNWEFKWYWIAAIPLVIISIILPMSAGPVLRSMLQVAASYKGLLWRLYLAFGLISFAGLIVLNTGVAGWIGFIIYFIVSSGCLVIYGGWKIYWAFREQRYRKRWIGFALFAVACIVPQFFLWDVPLALLPFFMLGVLQGWRYFRVMRQRHAARNNREKLN